MRKIFFTSILFTLICIGCSKVKLQVEVQRFDRDLFALNPDSLAQQVPALQQKYGQFFDLYCSGIINVGAPHDSGFIEGLHAFLINDVVRMAYDEAQNVYPDTKTLDKKLSQAFSRYKESYPNDTVPQIITFISGFNQSIMLTPNSIGVGLDKYLGTDYELYTQLGFYKYLTANMYSGKIASDVMHSWAEGKYPYKAEQDELLSRMVWEGKLLYFTKQMLPSEPDTCIFGYNKAQLEICEANEGYMWLYLIENKLLFSTRSFTIAKFTEERPFTQEFSREAPGRSANWLGYRIVEKYMKKKNEKLPELMQNTDYRKILEESGYNPR